MNEIPISIFLTLIVIAFGLLYYAVQEYDVPNIIASFTAIIILYPLSQIAINGQLVQYFGGVSSTNIIVTGTVAIQNSALSYILLYLAIVSFLILMYQLIQFYQNEFVENPDDKIERMYE